MNPRFDEVSDVDYSTVRSEPDGDDPIVKLIDEKRCLGEIAFLAASIQERSRRIGTVAPEYLDVKTARNV
jgi:hypothetical protein